MKKKPTCEEMYETAIKELQFANLQVQHLVGVLDELSTISDTLGKAVIKNAMERHQIDKLIHAKLLFNPNK